MVHFSLGRGAINDKLVRCIFWLSIEHGPCGIHIFFISHTIYILIISHVLTPMFDVNTMVPCNILNYLELLIMKLLLLLIVGVCG